jgi:hypothetical protein
MTEIILPTRARNRAGTEFDPEACQRAITAIKLQYPVVVKWSYGKRRLGSHRWMEIYHSITINAYLKPERASQCLWHELAHAMQVERIGYDAYWETYSALGRSGLAYKANPFELEAKTIEKEFHAALQLTRKEHDGS